jgi:hypothetical protein
MMSPENRFTLFGIMLYLFVFTQFRAETRYKLSWNCSDWTNRPPGQAGRFFFALAWFPTETADC